MTEYRSYIIPVVGALALHGVILIFAAGSMFERDSQPHVKPFQHVKAELVDLKTTQNNAKAEELKRQQAAEAKAKAEVAKRKEAERKAAQKRAADKKAADKRAAEKQLAAKQAAEKQAAAKKAAEKQAAEKKAAEKKAQEQKAKQLALEKKQKAEAEKQAALEKERQEKARQEQERLAEQKRQEALEQERRQQALAEAAAREEQARIMAEQDAQAAASAESIIRSAVTANWRRPPSARNGMEVVVRIHLFPTGEVDDAYVVTGSGDEAFDRGAVNAVMKAERFPELQKIDPIVFDRNLRTVTLKFRPEDLRL